MRKEYIRLNAQILGAVSAVSKKEKEGPLGACFDLYDPDGLFGAKTWESAESEMQRQAFNTLLGQAGLRDEELGALFAGDLLNQCVGSAYGLADFNVPYFGLYGACSTCAEGLLLASIMVSNRVFSRCGAVTSSHFCSAERQFRTPIEYGAQRAPTAQWTVTGAGAFLVGNAEDADAPSTGAVICGGMPGKVVDMGICDVSNMGAAMAPAALDTLVRFFAATGRRPEDYDRIVTGDLGFEGGAILGELMEAEGYPMGDRYTDCGMLIYHRRGQDVHGGGSGCGCSAVVLASHFLPQIERGELGRVLFLSTGALMSPDSLKQGKSIPGVAHLLEICAKSPRAERSVLL